MKSLSKYLIVVCIMLVSGCKTTIQPSNTLSGIEWKIPSEPKKYHVEFNQDKNDKNNLTLTKENAYNLFRNIEENEAYIKKLELLITEMKKFYNAK